MHTSLTRQEPMRDWITHSTAKQPTAHKITLSMLGI